MSGAGGRGGRSVRRLALAALLWAAFAPGCREGDQPDCTADEGEGCVAANSVCVQAAQADTDLDTDEEAAALAECETAFCMCLEWAGCEWSGCDGEADTGF